MIALYITLGVLAYLMVGCKIAEFTANIGGPDEICPMPHAVRGLIMLLWPILSPVVVLAGLGWLCQHIHGRPK